MGFIIVLAIVILIILIIINHKIAKAFEQIVFAKGYGRELNAYDICFWLGIVEYLYVIALPNAKLDRLSLGQQKNELLNYMSSQSSEFNRDNEESN